MNLVDNFNAAADLANGEYVCFIGDDDGVLPEILNIAHWAKNNTVDSVRTNLIASYFWPDVKSYDVLKKYAGTLFIYRFSGKVSFLDVEVETLRCVRNGGQGYLRMGLPKTYHGLVKKKLLERVRDMTGHFFGGLSPDVFGAIAVAKFARRVATVDYPLTIGGTSVNSGAGASSAGKHKGLLEDAPHLRNRSGYEWPEILPRFYSVQMIWAESVVAALRETGRTDLLDEFCVPRLCALALASNPDFASLIIKEMYRILEKSHMNKITGTLQFCYSLITSQAARVINYGLRRVKSLFYKEIVRIRGLEDIEDAVKELEKYLDTTGRHFEPKPYSKRW